MAAVNRRSTPRSRTQSKRRKRLRWQWAIVPGCLFGIVLLFAVNLIYQVMRKPGELFAPFAATFSKSPEATWEHYGTLFAEHATTIITPTFLAALAQVESDGNPVARPPWRWQWSWSVLEIYRPASTALGMFQLTDGTFAEAQQYCIEDHTVTTANSAEDSGSCSFNRLYTRTLPSHAAELTSAYLHRNVVKILGENRTKKVGLKEKQRLATVIHLCGVSRGKKFATRGLKATPGERCGTHDLSSYLAKVDRMHKRFTELAQR